MDELPPFPSREHSVHRFTEAGVEVLGAVDKIREELDLLVTRVREGDVPLSTVEYLEELVAGVSRNVDEMSRWESHETGRSAQQRADVNGFLAEFKKLMNDSSLGSFNSRAIMALTPPEVVDALLARVDDRPPVTDGWTMQSFRQDVVTRLAERWGDEEPEAAPHGR